MATIALLRFEAPLMSFGGVRIDAYDRAGLIPTPSLVTGLFGAALGIPRRNASTLQAMQDSIQVAVAVERSGRVMKDYQTADLSKPYMVGPMWTVEGRPVERAGSEITSTRQQWRQYIADGAVVASVEIGNGFPVTIEALETAMLEPKHPLFIGRANCPPSGMIWQGSDTGDMLESLSRMVGKAEEYVLPAAIYPPEMGDLLLTVVSRKDWRTGQHTGAETYVRRAA